jgi:hypothetical protein
MHVAVDFQNDRLEMDVPEERLVGRWDGPNAVPSADPRALVLEALERPRDYPALRQAVVPGDQVAIAFDPLVSAAAELLAAVFQVLERAGVEAEAITVVAPREPGVVLPPGVALEVHDPEDRTHLAYLATTREDQRVYLNRHLTDADLVLPLGRLGYDPVLGYRGPWSALFPDLSDADTLRAFRARASVDRPEADSPRAALNASTEVSWLLGSQFHLGILDMVTGLGEVVAGLESSVRDQGVRSLDRHWSFQAASRAELVVAGIGRAGTSTTIDELAEGLATAARLAQRGGKIVLLSRADGTFGPAVRRLMGADEPGGRHAALRGHETDRDYPAALRIAQALAWADVYLLSALDPGDVDELSIVALDRPEEARRLVALAGSCTVISHAERTRAATLDPE